jgi:hypothetical protein
VQVYRSVLKSVVDGHSCVLWYWIVQVLKCNKLKWQGCPFALNAIWRNPLHLETERRQNHIFLRTWRSSPEGWDLEKNPISLQTLKFSMKFKVRRLSAVWSRLQGYCEVKRKIVVHQSYIWRCKNEKLPSAFHCRENVSGICGSFESVSW